MSLGFKGLGQFWSGLLLRDLWRKFFVLRAVPITLKQGCRSFRVLGFKVYEGLGPNSVGLGVRQNARYPLLHLHDVSSCLATYQQGALNP